MLNKSFAPEQMDIIEKFIPNYHINLVDIGQLKDSSQFKTDLQVIFQMLKYRKNKQAMREYIRENEQYFRNVDIDTYNVLRVLLHSQNQLKDIRKIRKNEEAIDMCEALQGIYDEGVEEGIKEGIKQGILALIETYSELGQSKENALKKIMEKFDLDEKTAKEYIEEYWK